VTERRVVRADKTASLPTIDLAATLSAQQGLRLRLAGSMRPRDSTQEPTHPKPDMRNQATLNSALERPGGGPSGEAGHPARSSGDRLDVAALSPERIELAELAEVGLWG
jgi:hypothetical protein